MKLNIVTEKPKERKKLGKKPSKSMATPDVEEVVEPVEESVTSESVQEVVSIPQEPEDKKEAKHGKSLSLKAPRKKKVVEPEQPSAEEIEAEVVEDVLQTFDQETAGLTVGYMLVVLLALIVSAACGFAIGDKVLNMLMSLGVLA